MKQIAISKFKTTCFAVLEDVRRSGKPIRVTRFGKPVADVVPPAEPPRQRQKLGAMKGTIRIVGDIISPAVDENDWEVLAEGSCFSILTSGFGLPAMRQSCPRRRRRR